jgi:hypothetical protein
MRNLIRMERISHRTLGVARAIRSAGRAASAVESGRSPRPSDLERLGISVVAFSAVNPR